MTNLPPLGLGCGSIDDCLLAGGLGPEVSSWVKDLRNLGFEGRPFRKRKRFAYLVQAANERDAKLSGYPTDVDQDLKADLYVLTFKEKVSISNDTPILVQVWIVFVL